MQTQGEGTYAGSAWIYSTSLSPFPSSSASGLPASSPRYTNPEAIGSAVLVSALDFLVGCVWYCYQVGSLFLHIPYPEFSFWGTAGRIVSAFSDFDPDRESMPLFLLFEISRLHELFFYGW